MPFTIIADDLTGACDAGAVFTAAGRVGVFVYPAWSEGGREVAAVDTESRALGPAEAAERARALASQLGERLRTGRCLKKIDSTLRGPIGAELDALLSTSHPAGALLCPAFPDQGRTVVHGILKVHGRPAHETAVGRDPDYPGRSSDLLEIFSAEIPRRLIHVPLKEVRGSEADLARGLVPAPGTLLIADAETPADLDALARAAVRHPSLLLAGSAGLALALARALGLGAPPVRLPAGRAWLIVAGSQHPATRAQLHALEAAGIVGSRIPAASAEAAAAPARELEAGRPAFLTPPAPAAGAGREARGAVAERLARAAASVLARVRPDLVVVTGGETANALMRALGARRLELHGVPLSGLALGDLVMDPRAEAPSPDLPILTKAGGFGPPDLLLALLRGTAP